MLTFICRVVRRSRLWEWLSKRNRRESEKADSERNFTEIWRREQDKSQGWKRKQMWVQLWDINWIRKIYSCRQGATHTAYHLQMGYRSGIIWSSTVNDTLKEEHCYGQTLYWISTENIKDLNKQANLYSLYVNNWSDLRLLFHKGNTHSLQKFKVHCLV